MHIGYVGAGNMGGRFINRLIDGGHEVTVFDRRPEITAPIAARGGKVAGDAGGTAAGTDAVFTSLPDPSVVEAVAFEVIPLLPPGGVFVDMSTSTPELARRIAAACDERGAAALDAPVSNGGVFITVGGRRDVFERLKPAFEAMCEHVLYVGEAGQGQVAKLVRQYVSFTGFFTLIEALLIAAKAGADVKLIEQFIGDSVGQPGQMRSLERLYAGDFGEPETSTAKLDIVAKDLSLAVALAEAVGAPSDTGSVTSGVLRDGQEEGWGLLEYWAAVRVLESRAGLALRLE